MRLVPTLIWTVIFDFRKEFLGGAPTGANDAPKKTPLQLA